MIEQGTTVHLSQEPLYKHIYQSQIMSGENLQPVISLGIVGRIVELDPEKAYGDLKEIDEYLTRAIEKDGDVLVALRNALLTYIL